MAICMISAMHRNALYVLRVEMTHKRTHMSMSSIIICVYGLSIIIS